MDKIIKLTKPINSVACKNGFFANAKTIWLSIDSGYLCALMAIIFSVLSFFIRPLLPIDETRYLSVAWEMWLTNDYLLPRLNGELYSHKPPLLFWLVNLAWAIFGVSDFVARIVVPVVASINFVLVAKLAQLLYPSSVKAKWLAPWILFSLFGWQLYLAATMFDLLLSVFVLAFIICVVQYAEQKQTYFKLLAGLFLGLGLLTKGPVMFLFCFAWLFTYPFWRRSNMLSNKKFAIGVVVSVIIGVVIVLLWAIPAAIVGGEAFAQAIFVKQSAGRMANAFAHARPFFWYVMVLPVLLYPLPLLKSFWRIWLKPQINQQDYPLLLPFIMVLLVFSLISGKQIHYIFPAFPWLAILVARHWHPIYLKQHYWLGISFLLISFVFLFKAYWFGQIEPDAQVNMNLGDYFWTFLPLAAVLVLWQLKYFGRYAVPVLCLTTSCSVFALFANISPLLWHGYNIKPIAQFIDSQQQQGKTIAYLRKYHNQFQFAGRLRQPLVVLDPITASTKQWLLANPKALVVFTSRKFTAYLKQHSLYQQRYRSKYLVILRADNLAPYLFESHEYNEKYSKNMQRN